MTPKLELALAAAVVTACAAATIGLILIIRPLLIRFVMARPNERSSHAVPTPQGGGVAVMLAVTAICSALIIAFPRAESAPALLLVLTAAAGLTVLGLADDARALSVVWRFIGQGLAAAAVVLSLPDGFRLFPDILPLVIERSLLVIGVIYFVNAVNFLDGIDWITVAQVVPMTLGIAMLAFLGVVPATAGLLALALLGGMIGFAPFNKHPARLFLGDAGSLPIGLCLAWMLILVAGESKAAALLLALYTLSDSMITLGRRAWNREPILSAHKSHFYQRAVMRGWRVPQVSGLVFLLGLLLAGLAVAAAILRSPVIGAALLAIGVIATGGVLWLFARGRK